MIRPQHLEVDIVTFGCHLDCLCSFTLHNVHYSNILARVGHVRVLGAEDACSDLERLFVLDKRRFGLSHVNTDAAYVIIAHGHVLLLAIPGKEHLERFLVLKKCVFEVNLVGDDDTAEFAAIVLLLDLVEPRAQ